MYVIDASFVASLFLPDEASERVQKAAQQIAAEGAAAPSLLQLEITNILLVAERRKRINGAQLKRLSEAFDDLPVTLHSSLTPRQRTEILRLAQKHQLAAYDACYLELCMRLNTALASLDDQLRKAAAAEGVPLVIA